MIHPSAAPLPASAEAPERTGFAVAAPGREALAMVGTLTLVGERAAAGVLFVADRWITFRPDDGRAVIDVPMVLTYPDGREPEWALRVDSRGAEGTTFLLPGWGEFTTDEPAPLELLIESRSLSDLFLPRVPLALEAEEALRLLHELGARSFTDTLFLLAGRPRAPLGMLSDAHRASGHAALYAFELDSIALDPFSARSKDELYGMLVHELGHRLQRTRPGLFDSLWTGVAAIEDPAIYGFGSPEEHQAEAFRLAVTFLQLTTDPKRSAAGDLRLLELYELLMPGTRVLAGRLLEEPIYAVHRLRPLLLAYYSGLYIAR
jgi:hypothetical protein